MDQKISVVPGMKRAATSLLKFYEDCISGIYNLEDKPSKFKGYLHCPFCNCMAKLRKKYILKTGAPLHCNDVCPWFIFGTGCRYDEYPNFKNRNNSKYILILKRISELKEWIANIKEDKSLLNKFEKLK